ncbi:cytomatrix protein-like protein [Anaeramoeba ignava]|uniref:Cytomatrix protein-like protein n=1 Tax=Anaeramoeba ignava TaxID=1746090 RepID=A0A9Q0RD54_ANAIG|nr:cytomatrix protein-like protein [Anaeramoeba ignava]
MWKTFFNKFEIPCFEIEIENQNNKIIELDIPFISIIYSIIQQYQTISEQKISFSEFIQIPFNDKRNKKIFKKEKINKEIIGKILLDFIKLSFNQQQQNFLNSFKIEFLIKWVQNYKSENSNLEDISFMEIYKIYFEKIHQNLINLIEIDSYFKIISEMKNFSILSFMKKLITKLQKEQFLIKEKSKKIEELFYFLIENEGKTEKKQKSIESLYDKWNLELFKNEFGIELTNFNEEIYQIIEDKMMINKITSELIKELFSQNVNCNNILICKKSQKEKLQIYLTIKPKRKSKSKSNSNSKSNSKSNSNSKSKSKEEDENQNKCPICEETFHKNNKHFSILNENYIDHYRKKIRSIILNFIKYLAFYGEIIFKKLLFNKKMKGKFDFTNIQQFFNYLISKTNYLLSLNSIEILYSVYIPLLTNLISLNEEDDIINFVEEMLQKTNLKLLENQQENIILICCMKILNENEKLIKYFIQRKEDQEKRNPKIL